MKARATTAASTIPDADSRALISSDRVNSTDVYGVQREKIGSIDHMMIDKRSGVPAYAQLNALDAQLPMPAFMWDAHTDMNCVRHASASSSRTPTRTTSSA